jgi:hypothetical protein
MAYNILAQRVVRNLQQCRFTPNTRKATLLQNQQLVCPGFFFIEAARGSMGLTTRFDELQFYVAQYQMGLPWISTAVWDKSLGSTGPHVGLCSSQPAVVGYSLHPPGA